MSSDTSSPAKPGQVLTVQICLWLLFALNTCAGVLNALGSVFMGEEPDDRAKAGLSRGDVDGLMVIALITLAFAVVAVVLALNVPRRRRWVRGVSLVLAGLVIANSLVALLIQHNPMVLASLVLPVAVIGMQLTAPAKKWFSE